MEDIILGVLANILRAYAIYHFMELLHVPKKIPRYIKLLIYIVFVVMTSGGYYFFHNQILNIVTNIMGLCIISMLYNGSKTKKFVLAFCIYAINVIVEGLVFSLTGLYEEYSEMTRSIKECITSIGIYLCILVLKRTCTKSSKQLPMKYPIWMMLLSVPVISVIEIFSMWHTENSSEINVRIEILGIFIINFAIFYLYDTLQDYYKQKSEKEEFRIAMEGYSNQIDVMQESWQKMRSLRHDLKHHLCELRFLAAQPQNKTLILDYVDEMECQLLNEDEYVSSGNKEIDGTLNYFLQSAHLLLNEVKTQVSVPEDMSIHSFMLNVILGNLLENAIRGAQESERKYLNIVIQVKQGVMFIKIENSYNGRLRKDDEKLLTTKLKSEHHGIGLENVRRIVDERNGDMEIKYSTEIFCVNIMLFLSECN